MKRFELSELKPKSHIHFIGIGGISMSGLAEVMLEKGYVVSGSDRSRSKICERLQKKGAKIYYKHDSENVEGADLVVHTAAVHEDNPEMSESLARNIRRIDRAEFLGAIMKCYKFPIGVAGTHGKTTTTSMLAHALLNADTDPTISLGGELDIIDGNIRTGKGEYFLFEACEYTNSFLKFFPNVAVITNIDKDHLDFFKDIEDIKNSFRKYALLTKDNGAVVACGDDKNVIDTLNGTGCNIKYYGFGDNNLYRPDNVVYKSGYAEFDVLKGDSVIGHIKLSVPGEHNVLNALASVAVCDIYGIEVKEAIAGIEGFKGTHRRFEQMCEINGAVVLADYAHHPTEIKATLKTAKKIDHNKTICVFQPHTYTRTAKLWDEFLGAFSDADDVILADIYAAREKPDGVTTSERLATQMGAKYFDSFEKIAEYIKENAAANDMVFIMGAGDIIEIISLLE